MAQNDNTSINLIDLDQQGLMNSFKNSLRDQDEFKDYDFSGSAMNVLLDLLAMNTFKNAFYLNMGFSERWLDSAQLRSSIFSQSKTLNYLPRSKRSAIAKVKVTFTASGESQPYIVQKGSQLSTLIKSKTFTFTVPETLILSSTNTSFTFTTDIYEGVFYKDSYVYVVDQSIQRFKITNRDVDTSSLSVTVFEDGKDIGDVYKYASTLLDLNGAAKVFFLQPSETGNYEVLFGDNILGRRPKPNSLIILDYRVSNGIDGNGAKSFSVDFDPTNNSELLSTPVLEVIEASHNGQSEESNESIKYYAPRAFQTQERGVVSNDYKTMLKSQFPEINAIAVFGGEELIPPVSARVFISIDLSDVDGLPNSKKDEYRAFLKNRATLNSTPEFIEPEFLYLAIKTIVRYNINTTNSSINRIKTVVNDAIVSYAKNNLNDFATTLRYSPLVTLIDSAEESIISNITDLAVYKKIVNPPLLQKKSYVIDYGFALENEKDIPTPIYSVEDNKTVSSSPFIFQGQKCYFEDDSAGIVRIVKINNDSKTKIVDIGTVDYERGIIKINDMIFDSIEDSRVNVYVQPRDRDVSAVRNNILTLEPQELDIIVEAFRN